MKAPNLFWIFVENKLFDYLKKKTLLDIFICLAFFVCKRVESESEVTSAANGNKIW